MLSYNGEKCRYDELGNPYEYRNHDLTWDYGRHLINYDTTTYSYDANGIRRSKTVNDVTTHYFTNGTQILGQYDGNLMLFYYGVDGISGFSVKINNNTSYYTYKKNILGDIIGIYDSEGNEIARYTYDAWGKQQVKFYNEVTKTFDITERMLYTEGEPTNEMVAVLNPFRYRGYYYDYETGLYYLNSRYYDPETGRFINADDVSILNTAKEEINGLNLYAYCFNNPVNDIDEYGCWSLKKALKKSWKKIVRAVVVVAVATAAVAATVATLGSSSILIAGIVAAAANTLNQVLIKDRTFSQVDWLDVGITLFSATIAAYVPGGLFIKSLTETSANAILNNVFKGETTTLLNFALDVSMNFISSYASNTLSNMVNEYMRKSIVKSCFKGLSVNTGAAIYQSVKFVNEKIIDGLIPLLGNIIRR